MPRPWFRLGGLLAVVLAGACRQKSSPPEALGSARPEPQVLAAASAAGAAERALTHDFIMNGPDEQVQEAIVERVLAAIGDNWNDEARIVRALPRGLKMVYTTRMLQAEVMNGGFNQYFWNSSGKLADEALAGYRLIGAKLHAKLLEEAIEQRRAEEPEMKRLRETGTQQAFSESYKHSKLQGLDRRFRGLSESVSRLRMDYIRAHPQEFLASALEGGAP
jgi:hypothetical protein